MEVAVISPEKPEMPSPVLPKFYYVLNISLKLDFFLKAVSDHSSLAKFIHSFNIYLFIYLSIICTRQCASFWG